MAVSGGRVSGEEKIACLDPEVCDEEVHKSDQLGRFTQASEGSKESLRVPWKTIVMTAASSRAAPRLMTVQGALMMTGCRIGS